MSIIQFPWERVLEINLIILNSGPGMRGQTNIATLQGALSRIEHKIHYDGLDDIFEIAATYTQSIAVSHAFSDANKRTALMVALEYLSLNGYEIEIENDNLANVMVDLVLDQISISEFADILYSQYLNNQS